MTVQMDRAGDGGGITADLGAVAAQQRTALSGVGGVAARDVPQIRVLSDPRYNPRHLVELLIAGLRTR